MNLLNLSSVLISLHTYNFLYKQHFKFLIYNLGTNLMVEKLLCVNSKCITFLQHVEEKDEGMEVEEGEMGDDEAPTSS